MSGPMPLPSRARRSCFCRCSRGGLILQVGVPVDLHRAGDVTLLIEQNVFVRFDDADIRILPMLVDPGGADQNFGMGITWHGLCLELKIPKQPKQLNRQARAVRRSELSALGRRLSTGLSPGAGIMAGMTCMPRYLKFSRSGRGRPRSACKCGGRRGFRSAAARPLTKSFDHWQAAGDRRGQFARNARRPVGWRPRDDWNSTRKLRLGERAIDLA